VLAGLLLPGPLAAAAQRLGARGSIWYAAGPGLQLVTGGAVTGDDTFRSVPPQAAEPDRLPLLRAAQLLTSAARPEDFIPSCEHLLTVADPASNTITVSWAVTAAAPGAEEASRMAVTAAAHNPFRSLIAAKVERFLEIARDYERRLVHRPCLHLAFVGDGAPPAALEDAVEDALKQIGLYLADLQVRWIRLAASKDPAAGGGALWRDLLAFHLPWEVTSDLRVGLEPHEHEHLAGELERFAEELENAGRALGTDPLAWMASVQALRSKRPELTAKAGGGAPANPSLAAFERPTSFPVALSLAVRQWQGSALELPLAPTTLVLGANASGKTSLAEALCCAHAGLPRPRLEAPEGATRWSGPAPRAAGTPSFRLLRLVSGDLSQLAALPSRNWEALHPRDLLALFADDADLEAGKPGDLSFVTWLPFPGVKSATVTSGSPTQTVAIGLAKVAARLHRLQRRMEGELAEVAGRPRSGTAPATTLLPSWLYPLVERVLGDARRGAEEVVAKTPSVEAQAQFDEVKAEQQMLPPTPGPVPRELVEKHLVAICREIEGSVLLAPFAFVSASADTVWRDLSGLAAGLGSAEALFELARKRLPGEWAGLRREIGDLVSHLAERLFTNRELEMDLRRYLSLRLDPTDDDRYKPNTASLVRIGQAERLARWIACSGSDWPLVVIDEPALGQDEPSCARALVRFLRMARKVESRRWAAALTRSPTEPPPSLRVESVSIEDLEGWDEARHSAVDPASGPVLVWRPAAEAPALPLPPQVVALSYRETALSVVAELEGTVLDDSLRCSLEQLVPRTWWDPLLVSLRAARRELLRDAAAARMGAIGGADGQQRVPSALLRPYWSPDPTLFRGPAPDLSQDWQQWANAACTHLERLGLFGIADEVAAEIARDPARGGFRAALRLLLWLLATDLLPATLADGETFFDLAVVSFRAISRRGGIAKAKGPTALRRVVPYADALPPLPESWRVKIEGAEAARPQAPPAAALSGPAPQTATAEPAAPAAPAEPAGRPPDSSAAGEAPSQAQPWQVHLEVHLAAEEKAPVVIGDLQRELAWSGLAIAQDPSRADAALQIRSTRVAPYRTEWSAELKGVRLASREGSWDDFKPAVIEGAVRSRAAALARGLVAGRRVNLVFTSYAPRFAPVERIAFRFAAEPRADELTDPPNPIHWEKIFGRGLTIVRDALLEDPTTQRAAIYQTCTPATALRIGAVLHRATRLRLLCDHAGSLWDLDAPPPSMPRATAVEHASPRNPAELHLLLSVSTSIRADYESWEPGSGISEATVIEILPPAGPGHASIDSAAAALAFAEEVYRIAYGRRVPPSRPIRIFAAAPAALMVAVGRGLNALGEIVAMDLNKQTHRYFEAFRFRA
jgi:hypothetical protein